MKTQNCLGIEKGFYQSMFKQFPDQILNFKTLLFDGLEAFTTPEYLKIVVYVHSLSIITWQPLITWLATNSLMLDFSNSEKCCLGWDVCTVCVIVKIYVFPPYSLITSATPVSGSWVRLMNTNQPTFFECECSLNEYNNPLSLHSNSHFNPTSVLLAGMPLKCECECAFRIQASISISVTHHSTSLYSHTHIAWYCTHPPTIQRQHLHSTEAQIWSEM